MVSHSRSYLGLEANRCEHDSNSEIPGFESEANLGVCQRDPWTCSIFPDYTEGKLPERAYMWSILWTLREHAGIKILETARKDKIIQAEERKDELIEIYPEILNEILSAPALS